MLAMLTAVLSAADATVIVATISVIGSLCTVWVQRRVHRDNRADHHSTSEVVKDIKSQVEVVVAKVDQLDAKVDRLDDKIDRVDAKVDRNRAEMDVHLAAADERAKPVRRPRKAAG